MSEQESSETSGQDNTNADSEAKEESKSTLLDGKEPETKESDTKEPEAKEEKKEDEAKEEKKEDKVEGAPEKYESFTVPEGLAIDDGTLDKFGTVAKELNLSQENAQKLVDVATENTRQEMQKQYDGYTETREGWVTDLKSDKEFGGEKFDDTIVRAKRALGKYGSDNLTKFLGESGYGDNNELVKMLARFDKATSEDSAVDGDEGKQAVSAADALYPNQGKK
jgi:hypothetical protein